MRAKDAGVVAAWQAWVVPGALPTPRRPLWAATRR